MPIVTCPSCRRRYDAGTDEDPAQLPDNLSMKVVCPACGQWVRLPEEEPVDPPNVPGHVLTAMMAQSRLLDQAEAAPPSAQPPREPERDRDADRPRRRSAPDADHDRPRRRRFEDEVEDEYDRPRRRREFADEDDPGWSGRQGTVFDDYDDYPRRQSGDGLGITSLVLGIVSCVIALGGICCFLFTGLGVITGVTGVILGFVARGQRPDSGPARAGIILGFAGIALSVAMLGLMLVFRFAMAAPG